MVCGWIDVCLLLLFGILLVTCCLMVLIFGLVMFGYRFAICLFWLLAVVCCDLFACYFADYLVGCFGWLFNYAGSVGWIWVVCDLTSCV